VTSELVAQLVGGIGAGLLAFVGRKVIPLLRMSVRLLLDMRRKVRRLEAALDQGTIDGAPPRPRTVTPAPDQLELDAQRVLGELDRA
jgi:hypothetical protein